MREYLKIWLNKAFTKSLGLADLLCGLSGSALSAFKHYHPEAKSMIEGWEFQILFWALVLIVGLRLIMAPYWIWRDQQAELSRLREETPANAATSYVVSNNQQGGYIAHNLNITNVENQHRTINSVVRQNIVKALLAYPLPDDGKVTLMQHSTDTEVSNFSAEWLEIFKMCNWKTERIRLLASDFKGIAMEVKSETTPGAAILQHTLKQSGYTIPGGIDKNLHDHQIKFHVGHQEKSDGNR
jgi:hypothetical protein